MNIEHLTTEDVEHWLTQRPWGYDVDKNCFVSLDQLETEYTEPFLHESIERARSPLSNQLIPLMVCVGMIGDVRGVWTEPIQESEIERNREGGTLLEWLHMHVQLVNTGFAYANKQENNNE